MVNEARAIFISHLSCRNVLVKFAHCFPLNAPFSPSLHLMATTCFRIARRLRLNHTDVCCVKSLSPCLSVQDQPSQSCRGGDTTVPLWTIVCKQNTSSPFCARTYMIVTLKSYLLSVQGDQVFCAHDFIIRLNLTIRGRKAFTLGSS